MIGVLGKLKVENTESVLIDIRGGKVGCDKEKNKTLKDADKLLSSLISNLQERKKTLVNEVEKYFDAEKEKIKVDELNWREKEEICKNLMKFHNSKESDEDILKNSKYIVNGLLKLHEPQKFKEIKLISALDHVMHIIDQRGTKLAEITVDELKELLSNYSGIAEKSEYKYKC